MKIKSFDNWYKAVNEQIAGEPVAEPIIASAAESSSRDAIMTDVDAIMTSLETLAGELQEELEAESANQINEASGDKKSLVMQWIWFGPRMVKKQKQINNMKLKESDMEIAAAKLQGSDDSDKKKYLVDKSRQLSQNIKEIQAQINDMAAGYGSYVEGLVKKTRLEGDLAVVKAQVGNIKDPKEMKERMRDLMAKIKEEDTALQDMAATAEQDAQDAKGDDKIQILKKQKEALKDQKEDIDGMADGPEKEMELAQYALKLAKLDLEIAIEDPNQSKTLDSAKEKVKKAEEKLKKLTSTDNGEETPAAEETQDGEETPDAEETQDAKKSGEVGQDDGSSDDNKKDQEVKNSKQGKLDRIQKMIDTEEEKLGDSAVKDKIKEYKDAIEQLESKGKKSKEDQNKIDVLKVALKSKEDELAKSKADASPKLDKLKKLKDDIMAKENWQIEGTELGRIFEMEISKLEMEYTLNESFTLNIKDRFKKLI